MALIGVAVATDARRRRRRGAPGTDYAPLLDGMLDRVSAPLLGAVVAPLWWSHAPSVFGPHGTAAERIAVLGWLSSAVAAVVFLIVMAALAGPLARNPRGQLTDSPTTDATPDAEPERRWVLVLGGGVPILILLGVYVVSTVDTAILAGPAGPGAPHVEIIGRQWWWEVHYPQDGVVTANELHIPVGRRVQVDVRAADVDHSVWVPELHGKLDAIPGHPNTYWIEADTPGVYLGECAEYCGVQHTHMDFLVVADLPAAYARWVQDQRAAAQPPSADVRAGADAFLAVGCAGCHTVRGTPAAGQIGPDLTHVATRRLLAAGSLPNTRGELAGWIGNAPALKPGTQMPPILLTGLQLRAIVDYLERLK